MPNALTLERVLHEPTICRWTGQTYASPQKELCPQFSQPSSTSVRDLKRLVRYLVRSPRLTWTFNVTAETADVDVLIDTDVAGCSKTRRSTSGGMIFMAGHLLRHWSTTQPTIALSSGEAELVGIVRGASQALGFQSLARDLGFDAVLHLKSDASAAIGICRRRGLGKIRHLAVSDLWIQERLRERAFNLDKVAGVANPADALTKHIGRPTLLRLLPLMNVAKESGRPTSAPSLVD